MKILVLGLAVALFGLPAHASPAAKPVAAVATAAPTVKLIDPGTGKKKVLRLTARKRTKQTMVMTMAMGMTMDLGGSPVTQKIPVVKVAMDLVVNDVAKNGDIQYTFTMREPEVVADASTAPAVVDAMKAAMKDMAGVSGHAVITNRGFAKQTEMTVPPGASAQTKQLFQSIEQSMAQMCAPVPLEAVGVGATWETTTKVAQNGMRVTQVATTELVSLHGSVMSLKVKIAQSAPPQTITANGATVDLQSYKASGSGESTIDLESIVPTRGQVTLKSDMKMKSGAQPIGMSFDVAVTVSSK